MLELKKGKDLLSTIGGIRTLQQAQEVFADKLNRENLTKLNTIKNEEALIKIANAIVMCNPDTVLVNSGSEADRNRIRKYAIAKKEEKRLTKDGHTIHFDLPEDQARLVNQTFYITNEGESLNSLAKGISRTDAMDYVKEEMPGIMEGMTLIVGFYSRGPVGAEGAIPAIEMSSSGYVLHSAEILYRNCFADFDKEVERVGFFFTNVHSEGENISENVPKARIFMDRSWFTTYCTYCTYAGNTLLLKKGNHRFAVDYCTYYKREQQLSEHMFITGMTGPNGRKTFFCGSAPSGCGKTTTAMVGSDFIGDDLAQLWIDKDGVLRAINPENGIFGILQDVNREGDPHLMDCLRGDGTEVIWTNVMVNDGSPYWVGNGENCPNTGFNFQGEWYEGKKDKDGNPVPMSSKNSRCTLLASAISNHNTQLAEDPKGVPVKVITYSGRDGDTMPPVRVARNSDEGVVIGASVVSKATATEVGVSGVRRQPWANAPFIPGSLAGYMNAQFQFFNSKKFSDETRPIIAGLNYFLTYGNRGGSGDGLLGEKKDVKVWLGWLDLYVHGDVQALETPIGYMPKYEDLKKLFAGIDKEYPREIYDMQFAIYVDKIIERIDMQSDAYRKEQHISVHFFDLLATKRAELIKLKEKFGSIVQIKEFE
ncbi:phosphoenolpyruvate carboxykinase (GTP) [Desulforhopalus vacuolatus]|uniref:phosphoenolpyruvate carboxykinase (GTP) n=1 Tax=Desulforhopalus vacuolatus TaxID=40414 RepID=UPI0019647518|nr:phosphoenolpyruvate carboxykinase (GTP) [Desulforhopalus vacuolatus]MBM9520322.1 phosphoenolpyruvate carboxykinase (GTP) [Desulforhopalus vacuolatus]